MPYGSVATDGETTGVVRIDSIGEVFIRLDPEAVRARCSSPFPTRRAGEPGGVATGAVGAGRRGARRGRCARPPADLA
ncbi:MAG: hypothetical protein M3N32_04350, partial [Actinomycetota bacterium]|nr:hypothetical protein [Actinomycetota bacterium]